MPYCEIMMQRKLDKSQESNLESTLAKEIEAVTGKKEQWITTHFVYDPPFPTSEIKQEAQVIMTVENFSPLSAAHFDQLIERFRLTLSKLLDVSADRIYIVFEPIAHWGLNE